MKANLVETRQNNRTCWQQILDVTKSSITAIGGNDKEKERGRIIEQNQRGAIEGSRAMIYLLQSGLNT
jgi:hypothetical protein